MNISARNDNKQKGQTKMTTQRRTTQAALCAKAIRQELKKLFPNTKFQVTCKNYSGGNSVDVDYTDGPALEKVEAIVNKYEYGSFDGMTDCYNYDNVIEGLPQTKYLFVHRTLSVETRTNIIKGLNFGDWDTMSGYDQDRWISCTAKGLDICQ